MPVITSISGIRGTIGGDLNDSLNPIEIMKFIMAYGSHISSQANAKPKIVIGRDARISGQMVDSIVVGTLLALGIDVVNIGLATTPTTELAVVLENADGGIIITASHNPKHWNALKLLNNKGEFLDKTTAEKIFERATQNTAVKFVEVDELGVLQTKTSYVDKHIELIKKLPLVDVEAIKQADFKVVIDCVNSVGSISVPQLLRALGVENITELNNTCDGQFAHNPEPLPENLTEICSFSKQNDIDVGFVVDPDVDRLAIIDENGSMFGEEYTLVSVADYVLAAKLGATVSNLSSSRALSDITKKYGQEYYASAVGELNVVEKMKEVDAVIGGEGNGGVIYPDLHYGRDALVGIALFLSQLAKSKLKVSQLKSKYPEYQIIKRKRNIVGLNVDEILKKVETQYKELNPTTIDGVKIDFPEGWVHLRKSNTEPIIRIYAESKSAEDAQKLIDKIEIA